jgi:hypothetical protein
MREAKPSPLSRHAKGIMAVMAGMAVAALASALHRAQMNGTMNNARQLYLAQFQIASDGANTGDANMAWVGDYFPR